MEFFSILRSIATHSVQAAAEGAGKWLTLTPSLQPATPSEKAALPRNPMIRRVKRLSPDYERTTKRPQHSAHTYIESDPSQETAHATGSRWCDQQVTNYGAFGISGSSQDRGGRPQGAPCEPDRNVNW